MVTSRRSRFRIARLYVTFRCNARCGYCNVWQDPVFFGHEELTVDGLRRCVDQLFELGINHIDFTGGEPALHRHLAAGIRHAKSLGMGVELTTNAIRFARQSDELVPMVDTLNVSLDTLSAQKYHAIRGTDTLDRTLGLVTRLREQHVKQLKLITVVTHENAAEVDDVIGFAHRNQIAAYLTPMFEYFPEQNVVRDPTRTARSLHIIEVNRQPAALAADESTVDSRHSFEQRHVITEAIRVRAHNLNATMNFAFLRHIDRLDPTTPTNCSAGSRILTIGPDGRVLLPCYHDWDSSIVWDRPYRDIVVDPEFIRVRDEEVGRRPACRRCAVFPYLGFSISHHLTEDFLLQAISDEMGKIKKCLRLLHPQSPVDEGQASRFHSALATLVNDLGSRPLRSGTHIDELYLFSAANSGVATDLAGTPVPVEEVLADHAQEDCWPAQRSPHRIARLLYADILPALVRCALEPETLEPEALVPETQTVSQARRLALEGLYAHVALWASWAQRYFPASGADPDAAGRALVRRWCAEAGDLLTAAGEVAAASSVAAVAFLFDGEPAQLAAWGGIAGHPQELYLVRHAVISMPPEERARLAPLCDPSVAPALTAVPETPSAAVRGETVAEPDVAAAGRGDREQIRLVRAQAWRYCAAGDTDGLRNLVRAWRGACAAGDPALVERILLTSLLGLS